MAACPSTQLVGGYGYRPSLAGPGVAGFNTSRHPDAGAPPAGRRAMTSLGLPDAQGLPCTFQGSTPAGTPTPARRLLAGAR